MTSSAEYRNFILDLLSGLEDVTAKPMMGEYLLYYRGRLFGGIYDDRLLMKPVPSVVALLPDAPRELPYEGSKEMLLVETESRDVLAALVEAAYNDLPEPKRAAKKPCKQAPQS